MKLTNLFWSLLIFCSTQLFGAAKDTGKRYLIVETDTLVQKSQVGYNLSLTQDSLGKQIYILNVRYKLNKAAKSNIGSDADLLLVFYLFPVGAQLELVEVTNSDPILDSLIQDVEAVKNLIHNTDNIDHFDFIPLIRHNGKLYKFGTTDIIGDGFRLPENIQYFPEYNFLGSNRHELNLLKKPYTEGEIAILQNRMVSDTSGLGPFFTNGLDGKWNIKAINKSDKTIDFWIHLIRVSTGDYSYGRFAEEIRFKINRGITDFKVQPLTPLFDEKHMLKYQYRKVSFNFKNSVELKSLLH